MEYQDDQRYNYRFVAPGEDNYIDRPGYTNSYMYTNNHYNRFYHLPHNKKDIVDTQNDKYYRRVSTDGNEDATYAHEASINGLHKQNRFGASEDTLFQFNHPTQPQQVPPRMYNGYPTYEVEVSPPFGKAYLPPTRENYLTTSATEMFTRVSPVNDSNVYTDNYDYNDFNAIESFSENDTFFSNDNDTFCGKDISGLGDKVYLFGIAFLIVVAVLLNGLQFAIFRTKPLRSYSFSVYLSALAVLDSFSLFGHIPRRWMNVLYETLDWGLGVTVYDTNLIACRGLTYFSYISRFLSAWVVVALAAERLIVSKDPYKKSKVRKPKTACQILIGLTIISLALNCRDLHMGHCAKG